MIQLYLQAQAGIRLSYKLHRLLQKDNEIVRGFKLKDGDILPTALNGFLYSTLRTKQQRRALVMSILKQFDEQAVSSILFVTFSLKIRTFPLYRMLAVAGR